MSKLLYYTLTALAGAAVGLFAMWMMQRCGTHPIEPITIHDTICIHDTTRIAAKTRTIYVAKLDTLIVRDTDSIAVTLPLEHKEYRDTFSTDTSRIELAVAFSGYNAKIDSVGMNYHFEVEPRIIEKKKGWRFFVGPSVQVGYGVAFGSPIIAAPYVGVGIAVGWGYHW